MKTYTVTNYATELNVPVYAENLTEAEYKAYTTYGLDAVGCNVSCDDNGDFSCTVAYKCWRELLDTTFKGFTMDDVLNHLIVATYAWLNFEHETYERWDYDGKTTVTTLCKAGFDYIHEHDPLGNYMDEIDFRW